MKAKTITKFKIALTHAELINLREICRVYKEFRNSSKYDLYNKTAADFDAMIAKLENEIPR